MFADDNNPQEQKKKIHHLNQIFFKMTANSN